MNTIHTKERVMLNKSRIIILVVLLLGIFILTGAQAQELRKERGKWVGEYEKTFKVESGGKLIIKDVRGDITIEAGAKGKVTIHEIKKMDIFSKTEAQAAMDEGAKEITQDGNIIEIGGPAFDRKWIQSKFKITLPKDFSCQVGTKGGDLSINGIDGEVKGSSGGGDIKLGEIGGAVKASTGGGDIEIMKTSSTVKASTGGGDVDVTGSGGSVSVSTGGGDVTVIETKDEVTVSTGGGDVEIKATQGKVKVSTGGGDVDVVGTKGNVGVSTGGGDLKIIEVSGDFKASTGGGDINVENITGSVKVSTGGGDVEMLKIMGPVKVSTGGGDIEAEMTITDFSKDHSVALATGGGNIDLTIPAKLPATIEARIKYRKKSWEEYKINSDFPLKTTTSEEGKYKIIEATGDINGGGDLIKLTTGGGNINIRSGK